MDDELSSHESALRKLPLPYSLALRLRDAGVAPEVVSEYIGVDESALEGIYRIAEAKLTSVASELSAIEGPDGSDRTSTPATTRNFPMTPRDDSRDFSSTGSRTSSDTPGDRSRRRW
ncbi:MAG TPA: hypothetical protein VE666_16400 [Mycobacterium sp.]|nr:hypothetical protein [Mycobacterium sp.]